MIEIPVILIKNRFGNIKISGVKTRNIRNIKALLCPTNAAETYKKEAISPTGIINLR